MDDAQRNSQSIRISLFHRSASAFGELSRTAGGHTHQTMSNMHAYIHGKQNRIRWTFVGITELL